jgi:hypothetical protein
VITLFVSKIAEEAFRAFRPLRKQGADHGRDTTRS